MIYKEKQYARVFMKNPEDREECDGCAFEYNKVECFEQECFGGNPMELKSSWIFVEANIK